MPSEDDIVQRIVLEGDKVVIAQFQTIGAAGTAAFDKVNKAAADSGSALSKSGAALNSLAAGFRTVGKESEEFGSTLDATAKKGVTLAQALRLIGRAAGIRELSKMSRQVNALGKLFEIAAPALLVAGLAALGNAGSKAAQQVDDLGASLKVAAPQMQTLQAAGAASGLSFDELKTTMGAVDKITKETAENTAKNAKEYAKLQDELQQTRDKSNELSQSFAKVGREGKKAAEDFGKQIRDLGQSALDSNRDFETSLRRIAEQRAEVTGGPPTAETARARKLRDLAEEEDKLREKQTRDIIKQMEDQAKAVRDYNEAQVQRQLELNKLNRELEANDKKEREVRASMQEARIEADRNATALEKLGINVTAANGKLKKSPEVLAEIATALGGLKDPAQKLAIEQDLIAAGINRKLIPALRQGSVEYAKFIALGKKIEPGFDTKQIATADKFAIALGQVGAAFSSLIDQMGLAVAPQFTGFLESVRDILVAIRPGLAEFAKVLAQIVGPTLTLIADIIRTAVVPAFQGIVFLFDQVAKVINSTFGTSITGMQLFVGVLLSVGVALRGGILLIQGIILFVGLLVSALQKVDWSKFTKGATEGFTAVIEIVKAFWGAVTQLATDTANAITARWQAVIDFFNGIWTFITAGARAAWKWVSDQANIAVDFVAGLFLDMKNKIIGYWTDIRDFIIDVWNKVKGKISDLTGGSASGSASVPAMARGGHVRGPGTSTSDSILARLSTGEFVHPVKAVQKYGRGFMESIRTLRFDPEGFNMGGLVGMPDISPKLRFAEGGIVPSRKNVLNLTVGDKTFNGLSASNDTMDELTRFATSRQIRSTGRKPDWKS